MSDDNDDLSEEPSSKQKKKLASKFGWSDKGQVSIRPPEDDDDEQ